MVDEDAALKDLSEIKGFIEDKKIVDIVQLVTSRSLSHLAMLQEKYYQVISLSFKISKFKVPLSLVVQHDN